MLLGVCGCTALLIMRVCMQGHAGTVPMKGRQDAMTAVAEAVLWIERMCGGGAYLDAHSAPTAGVDAEAEAVEDRTDDSLVCTTGSVSLWPGASNVIAGAANFSVDVRLAAAHPHTPNLAWALALQTCVPGRVNLGCNRAALEHARTVCIALSSFRYL